MAVLLANGDARTGVSQRRRFPVVMLPQNPCCIKALDESISPMRAAQFMIAPSFSWNL
jgi:hypothetical protein